MSWVAVIFATAKYNRFVNSSNVLKFLSVFQSLFLLISAIVFLAKMRSFGSSPMCNSEAVVVILRPFSAIKAGQKVGLFVVIAVLVIYTAFTIIDYWRGSDSDGEQLNTICIVKLVS